VGFLENLNNERSGIFLVDKPKGVSSFWVVNYVRRKLGVRRMGHAGTLDPAATGLLVVLTGKATKRFEEFLTLPKTYEATVEFGRTTDTGDATGETMKEFEGEVVLQKSRLEEVVSRFCGKIEQVPHPFSAIKQEGKRSYVLARKGKAVPLAARKVHVYHAEVVEIDDHRARLLFEVSSGTYIRSLAEDIGKEMGYGAYVAELRRIRVGEWNIESAKKPVDVEWEDVQSDGVSVEA